jgi:hypothetical protein
VNFLKKDPIGFVALSILFIVGVLLIIDWQKFANFGHTSPVHTARPHKKIGGLGIQCDWDDVVTPCTHRTVVMQKEMPQ